MTLFVTVCGRMAIHHESQIHDIIAAKEKEAAAKPTFSFPAALTSKRPMKSGKKALKARVCEFQDVIAAKEKEAAAKPTFSFPKGN